MIGDRCEYCLKKGSKLLQCTSKATQSIDIQGEVVYLCPWHASIVMRMLAKKARLEKQYQKVMEEINRQEGEFMSNWRQKGG